MGNIYHLSEINLNNKVFTPKVPSNFLVKNGYEDNKTKRICFSTTIDGCLRAMSQNLKDKKLYVHIPDKKYKIYKPTIDEVPDSKITNEVWILEPVKMKCVGIIQVKESIGDGLSYTFGNNTAELYNWDWIWIEKYKSSIYNEMKENNNMSNIYMEYLTESEREDLILEKELELLLDDIKFDFTYENVIKKNGKIKRLQVKLKKIYNKIINQLIPKLKKKVLKLKNRKNVFKESKEENNTIDIKQEKKILFLSQKSDEILNYLNNEVKIDEEHITYEYCDKLYSDADKINNEILCKIDEIEKMDNSDVILTDDLVNKIESTIKTIGNITIKMKSYDINFSKLYDLSFEHDYEFDTLDELDYNFRYLTKTIFDLFVREFSRVVMSI